MKRRRVTPPTAGGAVEASLDNIIGGSYSHDQTNAAAANLPRIPGLSVEHVPSFLHVLRIVSKFFQADRKAQPFTVVDWEKQTTRSIRDDPGRADSSGDPWNSGNTTNPNDQKNIHDSIMDRMEAVSNNNNHDMGSASVVSSNDGNHQRRFVQAVNAWLEEVQIHARRRKRQEPTDGGVATRTENPRQQQSSEKQKQPVPYSMFLYLWEMQQEHKRFTVRRSALFLSGLLLLRSKDCRFYIDQETHLADWISNIGVKMDGSDQNSLGANSNRKLIQLALLQKEAIALMSRLLDKGFGKKYVKLAVATKSLRHRCTARLLETLDIDTSSTVTPPGMANWRKLRDFALLHGRKEIQKVEKLLDRADECLEVLVPRIDGIRRPLRRRQSPSVDNHGGCPEDKETLEIRDSSDLHDNGKTKGEGDSSDSDEDDIDWEDGDEIESNDATTAIREQNAHLSAVENTMATMEKTAGSTLFSGGRLEIDFDRRVDEENVGNSESNEYNKLGENNARLKLKKIVRRLSTRHLVRLSAWLDGLRNSDNLVLAESASLVSLSPEKDATRLELIRELSALKQDVSTVVSSALRLGIKAHESSNSSNTNEASSQTSTSQNTVAEGQTRAALLPLQGMSVAPATRRVGNSIKRPPKKKNSKQKRFRRRIQINYNT